MIRFTKMHGAGNDFVVIDCTAQSVSMSAELAHAIADRQRGVGCDQILLVERPQPAEQGFDFRYRIFNADGSEVEQCGNGARCFVRYVHEHGLSDKTRLRVMTLAGLIEPSLEADGQVSVDMGPPRFDPAQVPFDTSGLVAQARGTQAQWWPLDLGSSTCWVALASMGNPHAVQLVDDVDAHAVAQEGPLIERHRRFASRVNAGFMQIVDRHQIRLRVFERGAGETLACGTGACAAAVLGIRAGLLDSPVRVETRGGSLTIRWPAADNAVLMTGPAISVFEGSLDELALLAGISHTGTP